MYPSIEITDAFPLKLQPIIYILPFHPIHFPPVVKDEFTPFTEVQFIPSNDIAKANVP